MELNIERLKVVLGGVTAVDDVSFSVQSGEILGLIGPNGAGKTSTINAISGYTNPTRGKVYLNDQEITGWSPEKLVRVGLARTFQGARLFGSLSVFENVLVSALAKKHRNQAKTKVEEVLERLDLVGLADIDARDLPAGDQRRLGLARALATEPQHMLLDEPAAGLNEAESSDLAEVLHSLANDGIGLVVIEHDMSLIMGLCDRIHVLDSGRTLFAGLPGEARRAPAVIEAYLGSMA